MFLLVSMNVSLSMTCPFIVHKNTSLMLLRLSMCSRDIAPIITAKDHKVVIYTGHVSCPLVIFPGTIS